MLKSCMLSVDVAGADVRAAGSNEEDR